MKWKSGIGAVAAAGSLALLLSGCGAPAAGGGAGDGGSGIDGTGDVKGAIEVAWWGGETRNAKTNAVIDMFLAKNKGVTIGAQSAEYGAYFDKLNVQASSKSLPCAVQLQGRQVNDYTSKNLLLPLDPMVEAGVINIDDIPEAVIDAGRGTDGNLYFLPYGAAYDAFGINTTLAAEAGVSIPEKGYTWDEFLEFLNSAQEGMPDGKFAIGSSGGIPNFFTGYTQANGLDIFGKDGKLGFTKDDLITYWNMWEELRANGTTIDAARTAEEPPGADQGYLANGVLMSGVIPGNALGIASAVLTGKGDGQEMTTIALPSGEAGSGNALFPSGFAIPKSCDNVPTAAAFIDFFTNDLEAGKSFAADNGAPTNTKVLDALLSEVTGAKKHELELYQEIIANDPPTIVFPPGYQATFEASFKRNYEEVAFGKTTVKKAVDKFFDEANASLGQ